MQEVRWTRETPTARKLGHGTLHCGFGHIHAHGLLPDGWTLEGPT